MTSKRPSNRSGKAVKGIAPTPDSFVSQIRYTKSSTSVFELRHSDISLREDASYKSHDINWLVPGYQLAASSEQGVATDIYETHISVENIGASTLYLRLQKPMGFRADPSALAMWEPITSGSNKKSLLTEIRPHTIRKYTFRNHSTSLVVPRQSMFNGQAAIHLYSMVPFQEKFADAGVDNSSDTSVSMIVTTTVHFQANDGDVGEHADIIVESFEGANRLDQVTPGPAVPIRVCDLHIPGKAVAAGAVYPSNASPDGMGTKNWYQTLCFFGPGTSKDNFKPVYDVDNMDPQTTYQLPFSVAAINNENKPFSAAYVRYTGMQRPGPDGRYDWPPDKWLVGYFSAYKDDYGTFYYAKVDSKQGPLLLPPSSKLTPIAGNAKMLNLVVRAPLKPDKGRTYQLNAKPSPHHYGLLGAADNTYAETAVQALTVIIKVVTMAVELASVFGFLAVPLEREVGQRVLDAE